MLDIARALCEENVMRSLTGLEARRFEELHKKFDAELVSRKLVAKPKRQRAPEQEDSDPLPDCARGGA